MKRILGLIVLACIAFGLWKGAVSCNALNLENRTSGDGRYSFLILGFDDAQKNTDAIVLASYNTVNNEASFLQIPRDTLVVYQGREMKINGVYPSLINSGKEGYTAALELTSFVERATGVALNGFVGFSVDAFSRLIDHIGGVDIDIPYDFVYQDKEGNVDISIPKGKHHLCGEEAVRFVRYRRGYSIGDLGRLDAQKLFISAFVTKLKSSINPSTAFKMVCDSGEGVITNIRLMDILGIAFKKNGKLVDANIKYASLPGLASVSDKGVSYFICNRSATSGLLSELGIGTVFDNSGLLCSRKNKDFINIYNATNITTKIYDDSELSEIVIPGG